MLPVLWSVRTWISGDAYDVVVFGSTNREEGTARVRRGNSFGPGAGCGRGEIHDQYKDKFDLRHLSAHRLSAAGGYDTDPAVLYNEDVAMHCSLARGA